MLNKKVCTKCGELKDKSCFNNKRASCAKCQNKYTKAYKEKKKIEKLRCNYEAKTKGYDGSWMNGDYWLF